MGTPNWKKVVDYLQFYILTVITTIVISLILNLLLETIEWEEMTNHLLKYWKVITIIYLGIIFLREVKYFREEFKDNFFYKYLVAIVFGAICALLYKAPSQIFGYEERRFFYHYAHLIVGSTAFLFGANHPRFGFAMSLSFLGVTILFFNPFADQLYILGALTGCAAAGFLLRKIIFTRWSELIPTKKPGVEILK